MDMDNWLCHRITACAQLVYSLCGDWMGGQPFEAPNCSLLCANPNDHIVVHAPWSTGAHLTSQNMRVPAEHGHVIAEVASSSCEAVSDLEAVLDS